MIHLHHLLGELAVVLGARLADCALHVDELVEDVDLS